MQRNQARQRFGKVIEDNVVTSLRMAGVDIKTSGDYDHNYKIDFALKMREQVVGVQVSLRSDRIKATIAKVCAMDVVSRFIYLVITKEDFASPDRQNGKELYILIENVLGKYAHMRALMLNISPCGLQVHAL
ncbi:hypothetical protein JXL19_09315 [bacterium]|nr:hypothetical protein [bacterium]